MTIGDTTMKIYKWVPVASEKKTKHKESNKENLTRKSGADSSNSNFSLAEDSNTCKKLIYSFVITNFFYIRTVCAFIQLSLFSRFFNCEWLAGTNRFFLSYDVFWRFQFTKWWNSCKKAEDRLIYVIIHLYVSAM